GPDAAPTQVPIPDSISWRRIFSISPLSLGLEVSTLASQAKTTQPVTDAARNAGRLDSIDLLRGFIMVIMAVDHTREFFSDYRGNPVDLANAPAAIFLTRFITHYCAPVFFFLAGTGAF